MLAADLTDDDAPARVRDAVQERHGRLDLLVNNAGAAWRATFADGGWENVRRHMELNFDAVVRLTEALLPLLRAARRARSSTWRAPPGASRAPGSGAYSASKFALAGWSDSLAGEEAPKGVHVGLVLPGFIADRGLPAVRAHANPLHAPFVSTPERGAQAIVDAGLGGKAERYVPRPYALAAAARVLAPRLVRRATGGKAGGRMVTRTGGDETCEGAARALARGGTMRGDGPLRRRLRGRLGRRVAAAPARPRAARAAPSPPSLPPSSWPARSPAPPSASRREERARRVGHRVAADGLV